MRHVVTSLQGFPRRPAGQSVASVLQDPLHRCLAAALNKMDQPPVADDRSYLLDLPDDVLLVVLAKLVAPMELLLCRVVCRRLRDLCLHPDLWRSVELCAASSNIVWRTALRLAPCLGILGIWDEMKLVADEVASTSCVVKGLDIEVPDQASADLAAAIIEEVARLGGLRTLSVSIHPQIFPESGDQDQIVELRSSNLLKAVHAVKDLYHLNLDIGRNVNDTEFRFEEVCGYEEGRTASLTKLKYYSHGSDGFLKLLLKTHADTLQDLDLSGNPGCLPIFLMKELPRLRFLKCQADDELFQLEALSNLEEVEIEEPLEQDVQTDYPGMANFFRHSSHLRSVQLRLVWASPAAHLLALAESHSAGILVTLKVFGRGTVLEPMAASLHRFPNLRTFETNAKCTDDFLRAVSPASAPNLTVVELGPGPARGECAHAWLHGPAVQDLLARNSRLHLRVLDIGSFKTCCDCAWCLWGCHLNPSWTVMNMIDAAFASHSKKAECPEDCLRLLPCTSCDPAE